MRPDLSDGSFQDFLQTDAPINQGNSGGALVNTRGELIGINSQILSPNGGGNIGIGFAIPSNMAKNVMDQLIDKGKVRRGMLGVGIQPVTADVASSLGLKQPHGVLVNTVTPGGAADKAGVKPGDVITAVNGTAVADTNTLRNMIASTAPGSNLTLTISRNGNEQQVQATVGELTDDAAKEKQEDDNGGSGGAAGGRLGLALTQQGNGVVVDNVDPDGPAARAGIQAGDVIRQVNRQPVKSVDDVRNLRRSRPINLCSCWWIATGSRCSSPCRRGNSKETACPRARLRLVSQWAADREAATGRCRHVKPGTARLTRAAPIAAPTQDYGAA